MPKPGPPKAAAGAKRAQPGLEDPSQLTGDATDAGEPQPDEAAAAKPAGNAGAPGAKKQRGACKPIIAQYTRVERLVRIQSLHGVHDAVA